MSDYKEMYFKLFNKVTDVIEELQQIQCQTEEICMQTEDAIWVKKNLEKKEHTQ